MSTASEGVEMSNEDQHDGMTHLVDDENADATECGLERTMWVSATQEPLFATCDTCVASR